MKIFSVLDTKADAYMMPICCATAGVALRSFEDSVNDGSSPFYKHPEDYILFEVGSFDEATGILTPSMSEPVARGVDLVKES